MEEGLTGRRVGCLLPCGRQHASAPATQCMHPSSCIGQCLDGLRLDCRHCRVACNLDTGTPIMRAPLLCCAPLMVRACICQQCMAALVGKWQARVRHPFTAKCLHGVGLRVGLPILLPCAVVQWDMWRAALCLGSDKLLVLCVARTDSAPHVARAPEGSHWLCCAPSGCVLATSLGPPTANNLFTCWHVSS